MYGLAMPYWHVADGFTGKTHVFGVKQLVCWDSEALKNTIFAYKSWLKETYLQPPQCHSLWLPFLDAEEKKGGETMSFWMEPWAIGVSFWPSSRCLITKDVDLSHWLTWILGPIHLCFKRKESRPLVSTAVCSNRYFPPKVIPQTNHQHDLQPHLSSDQSPGWLGYIKGLYYRREIIIKPIISPQRCRSPLT